MLTRLPAAQICLNGQCVCPPQGHALTPDSFCPNAGRGLCTNTQTDPSNCGACGTKCFGGTGSPALTGQCCNGVCCPAGTACLSGVCTADCNGIATNILSDPSNCSTCGNTCTGTTPACCGGACKDLSNDNNNCSTCGNVCATGASCIAGTCACPAGQVICTGSCVNTQTNVNNCGACGTVCATVANGSAGCVAGVCVVASCNAGFGNCDNLSSTGCETNLNTSNGNCGACGAVCPAVATCTNGACVCPAGTVSCNGTCLNTQSDINNCGFCGNVCAIPIFACFSSNCVRIIVGP